MRTFTFGGSWEIGAPPDRVGALLADLPGYPTWWPQILAVASLGLGRAQVLCRARLPYTLDLELTAVSSVPPRLESEVDGDLRGRVCWLLSESPGGTLVQLEQVVTLAPGPLAVASYVAAPLLRWNHEQMMLGGIAGLRATVAGGRGEEHDLRR